MTFFFFFVFQTAHVLPEYEDRGGASTERGFKLACGPRRQPRRGKGWVKHPGGWRCFLQMLHFLKLCLKSISGHSEAIFRQSLDFENFYKSPNKWSSFRKKIHQVQLVSVGQWAAGVSWPMKSWYQLAYKQLMKSGQWAADIDCQEEADTSWPIS